MIVGLMLKLLTLDNICIDMFFKLCSKNIIVSQKIARKENIMAQVLLAKKSL